MTVLVDTSVWVDHLRRHDDRLDELLGKLEVIVHPFVIGEVALGVLRRRTEVLGLLARMPAAPTVTHAEVMTLIASRDLSGKGIGYVDAHLLASAFLARASLWTRDKRLHAVASSLGVA
jgi:predicted nucleic acid-binding protein